MVTPKAELELAWQIERLAASLTLQAHLVANAQRYAQEHSWPENARRTAALYESLRRGGNQTLATRQAADKEKASQAA
jgi:hypothetical protein